MKSVIACCCISLLLVAGGIVTAVTAIGSEQNRGPATITLDGGHFGNISFPHKTHQVVLVDCNTCHNLYPQALGSIVKMKSTGDLKSRQVMNICTSCHFDRSKKGEKTGPTSCSGCHKD